MSASMGIGANYLELTGGSAGAAGTGAYTIAALVQPGAGNNNMGVATLLTSGSRVRSLFEDSLKLFSENDFTGFGSITQGQYYVFIQSKAAGAGQAVNFEIWPYNSGGTGTMTTGTDGTNNGDGTAVNQIRFGQAIDNANGLYSVLGIWTRQLSGAERQSLKTNLLSVWAGLGPAELIHTKNWNGTTGLTVAVGTATFVGVTGSVGVGADPSGFDFNLGVSVVDPIAGGASTSGASDGVAVGDGSGGGSTAGAADGVALGTVADGGSTGGPPDGVAVGDLASGGGTGGAADGIALGVLAGGASTGGQADTLLAVPVAVADPVAGGAGTGGTLDVVNSGTQVVHDQMVMPLAIQARTCLVTEVGKLANPPIKVQIRPGASFAALVDSTRDECCSGVAYVRTGNRVPVLGDGFTPLTNWSGPSASRARPTYYLINLEIGIYRCLPTISDIPNSNDDFPTDDQWLRAAQAQADDGAALQRVVCCLQGIYGNDAVVAGPTTPLENQANCSGVVVNVQVRAPACDCVG